MGWIYVFQDAGYGRGVKVGRCGSHTGMQAWNAAPCYSPRTMLYLAGWEIVAPVLCRTAPEALTTMSALETHLQRVCAPALSFPRNGREWFDLVPKEAIERICEELRKKPAATNRHVGVTITNDQFRNPAPARLGHHGQKVIAWIYREHLTGRLKSQLIDDWKTPKEIRRRYSRNGFTEEMAFTYDAPLDGVQNVRLLEAWKDIMRRLGPGPHDGAYGWLNDGAEISEVAAIYRTHGFVSLDTTSPSAPMGVRQTYNRPASRSKDRTTLGRARSDAARGRPVKVRKHGRRDLRLIGCALLIVGVLLAYQSDASVVAGFLIMLGFALISPLRRRRR